MSPEEIVKKLENGERPNLKKITKNDCVADSGKLRAVVIKGNEYFQIEEDVLIHDAVMALCMWYTMDEQEENEEMAGFDDQGNQILG